MNPTKQETTKKKEKFYRVLATVKPCQEEANSPQVVSQEFIRASDSRVNRVQLARLSTRAV